MAYMDKMREKLPMKGAKKDSEASPMPKAPSIEVEIGEEEGPEEEGAPEGDMEEEVSVGELAQFSDEELKAELEKRGMEVATGGASITPLPEAEGEEEAPAPAPQKKVKPA